MKMPVKKSANEFVFAAGINSNEPTPSISIPSTNPFLKPVFFKIHEEGNAKKKYAMYDENVTKNAWKSLKPNESLKKGINVPLAQVTNPKMKNRAHTIIMGMRFVSFFAALICITFCIGWF